MLSISVKETLFFLYAVKRVRIEHWRDRDFRMLFLNVIASDRMKLIPGRS